MRRLLRLVARPVVADALLLHWSAWRRRRQAAARRSHYQRRRARSDPEVLL